MPHWAKSRHLISGLPQVELSQEPQMPLAEGQLHCCHIALRNTGAMPLQDLRLAVAPTAVLLTQPHEAADPDPLTFLRGTPSMRRMELSAVLCRSACRCCVVRGCACHCLH